MSRTGSALVPLSISTNSPADTLVPATVIAASRLPIRTRMDMLPPSRRIGPGIDPTSCRPPHLTRVSAAAAPACALSIRRDRVHSFATRHACDVARDRILLCISGRHSRSFLKPSDARARAARRERRRLFVGTFCQLHDSLIIHADGAVCSTTSTAAAIDNCAHRAIVRLPANAQSVRGSSRSITQARISVGAIFPSDPSAGEASMDGYIDFASCPDDRLRLGWRVAAGERQTESTA